MRCTGNVASGAWIAELLSGWGQVGGVVPRGFEAYARVFHPAEARRPIAASEPLEIENRTVTWAQVAAAQRTIWHPDAQWGALSGNQYGDIDWGDGWILSPPEQGRLALDVLAKVCDLLAAHTTTSDRAIAGVWHGWGNLRPESSMPYLRFTADDDDAAEPELPDLRTVAREAVTPEVRHAVAYGRRLELPDREYVLLTVDVGEFTDLSWVDTAGLGWFYGRGPTPNILWPADRAWFLGSEIDFDSTLVGGTRALIDAIVAHPRLEAAEVTPDTDLTINADSINPLPAELQGGRRSG